MSPGATGEIIPGIAVANADATILFPPDGGAGALVCCDGGSAPVPPTIGQLTGGSSEAVEVTTAAGGAAPARLPATPGGNVFGSGGTRGSSAIPPGEFTALW